MAYSFPHTLTPGTPENVTDVMDNFTGHAADTEYAYSTYKTIVPWSGGVATPGGAGTLTATGSATISGATVVYLDPADYTANTRTTKYRLRVYIATNQTAPAINFTFGLYPVTVSRGAAGFSNTYTVGSVTSSSTVAYATPSASTTQQGNSGDFTAPVAGYYVIGIAVSGAADANSRTDVATSLQMRQV